MRQFMRKEAFLNKGEIKSRDMMKEASKFAAQEYKHVKLEGNSEWKDLECYGRSAQRALHAGGRPFAPHPKRIAVEGDKRVEAHSTELQGSAVPLDTHSADAIVAPDVSADAIVAPGESLTTIMEGAYEMRHGFRWQYRQRCADTYSASQADLEDLQRWSAEQATGLPVPVPTAILPPRAHHLHHWHIAAAAPILELSKKIGKRLSDCETARGLLIDTLSKWQSLHNVIHHKDCGNLPKPPSKGHALCRQFGRQLCMGEGRKLLSFQKTVNRHCRKVLRKNGGILRPFYNEGTLVFRFSTSPISAVWAHVSYLNLTSLQGAWARMVEVTDSVRSRVAASQGHHVLQVEECRNPEYPLGLYLTLDFFDMFLDRHCAVRCAAWGLQASQSPEPSKRITPGEQVVFPLAWSKLVWDPSDVTDCTTRKEEDPACLQNGEGNKSSGEESEGSNESPDGSGDDSESSEDMPGEALKASTNAEKNIVRRKRRRLLPHTGAGATVRTVLTASSVHLREVVAGALVKVLFLVEVQMAALVEIFSVEEAQKF